MVPADRDDRDHHKETVGLNNAEETMLVPLSTSLLNLSDGEMTNTTRRRNADALRSLTTRSTFLEGFGRNSRPLRRTFEGGIFFCPVEPALSIQREGESIATLQPM